MVNTFKPDGCKDLKTVDVDKTKPIEERLKQYVTEVKNPYMVRVGNTPIQIEFTGGRTFSDALAAALRFHNISD